MPPARKAALAIALLALSLCACEDAQHALEPFEAEVGPGSGLDVRVTQHGNECRVELLPERSVLHSAAARCQAPRQARLPHGERYVLVGAQGQDDSVWLICAEVEAPAFRELFESRGLHPQQIARAQRALFVLDSGQVESF